MKQHITIEQLNELSDKGKERLREWWIDNIKQHDIYIDISDQVEEETIMCCECELNKDNYPLLSIGQMIQFIREQELLTIYSDVIIIGFPERKIKYIDLCDALWEAVKSILNSNEKLQTSVF